MFIEHGVTSRKAWIIRNLISFCNSLTASDDDWYCDWVPLLKAAFNSSVSELFRTSLQSPLELTKVSGICYTPLPTLLPAVQEAQLPIPNIESSINRCAFSSRENWSTGRQSCSNLPNFYSTIVYSLSVMCGTMVHVATQQLPYPQPYVVWRRVCRPLVG